MPRNVELLISLTFNLAAAALRNALHLSEDSPQFQISRGRISKDRLCERGSPRPGFGSGDFD